MSSYEIVIIIIIIIYCFTTQEVKGVMGLMSDICVGGLKAKASSHTKQTNRTRIVYLLVNCIETGILEQL